MTSGDQVRGNPHKAPKTGTDLERRRFTGRKSDLRVRVRELNT